MITNRAGGTSRTPMGRRRWLRQTRAFAERYVHQLLQGPASLVFLVGWPTLWYVLVAHVFLRPAAASPERVAAAKAAYAVTFGLFGAFTVSLNGFVGSFTADLQAKRYRKFRSMPIAPTADLVGRFCAGFGLSIVAYGFLLVVGAFDGAAFTLRGGLAVPVVLVSLLAFCILGVVCALCIAVAVPRPEYATTMATGVLLVAFFATGFNGANAAIFPGPGWLLNVLPNTLATRVQLAHLIEAGVESPAFGSAPAPASPLYAVLLVAYAVAALLFGGRLMGWLVYGGEVSE